MRRQAAQVNRERAGLAALAIGVASVLLFSGRAVADGPLACRTSPGAPTYGPCKTPDPVGYFPAVGNLPEVIVANFGLLVPGSNAQSRQYVCDDVFGQPEAIRERRSGAGDIFLPTTQGLLITRDGCVFTHAAGDIAGKIVYDVAVDAKDPQVVFAIGDTPRVLWRSSDAGKNFTTVATFPSGLALLNVVLPPGRSKQVYVVGRGKGTSTPVGASLDDGVTFTMRDPGTAAGASIKSSFEFLAADPISPDVLYFTLLEADGDRLFRSGDGGATAVPLLKLGSTEGVAGLAFGATPATLYLAAKDLFPLVGSPPGALYISRDTGKTWLPARPAPEAGPQFNCLVAAGARLYACSTGQGRKEDFMLASSDDEGQSWTPIMRLGDLSGPKACIAPQCQAVSQWLCDTYTSCADGLAPTPTPEPRSATDAGSSPPPSADAAAPVHEFPHEDSGCACGLGSGAPGAAGTGALAAALLLFRLVRRRVRRQEP